MDILGFIFMGLSILGAALTLLYIGWCRRYTPFGVFCVKATPPFLARFFAGELGEAIAERAQSPASASAVDITTAHSEPETGRSVIEAGNAGSFITINGVDEQVKGSALYLELQSFSVNKSDMRHVDPSSGNRLREFKALLLAGRQLLIEHPSGEGKNKKFFLYRDRSDELPVGFNKMLRGTDADPGPAMKFANSDQTSEERFDALGKEWVIQDLIWCDVDVKSGAFFVNDSAGKNARVVMVLARCGDEWLLWSELRSGQGDNSLWVGSTFDPDVEIEVL